MAGDDGRMGRYNSLGWTIVLGLLAVVLAPVVVLAGEPALRLHRRGLRPRALALPAQGFDLLVMRFSLHPMVIAMTAPARWVRRRVRHLFRRRRLHMPHLLRSRSTQWGTHERLFPDDPPFLSGVREPRRPKPSPPSDAVALQPPVEHSALD
jgi:hypothetical protein